MIRRETISKLEEDINKVLSENIKSKFIDIKYSSSVKDGSVVHTAIIIFERV